MKKKGSALILTVALVALLLVLSATVAHVTASTAVTNNKLDSIDNLRLTAESGIEKGLGYIKQNYTTISPTTAWTNSTSVTLNIESGKYTGAITLYNYDINDSNAATKFTKYTIKSVAKSKDGKHTKTITANVMKKIEKASSFDPFYNILVNNTISLVNPIDNNKKKDFFINAGNNTSFTSKGHSYFQGKLKGNVFDKKNMTFTPEPVVVMDAAGTVITAPTFDPAKVPAKNISISSTGVKDSSGNPPVSTTIDGYKIILVNGNISISGTVNMQNTIILCTGIVTTSKWSSTTFKNSSVSAQTLDISNQSTVLFDGVPTLSASTSDAIKAWIKDRIKSTVINTQTSIPEGSFINYTEQN